MRPRCRGAPVFRLQRRTHPCLTSRRRRTLSSSSAASVGPLGVPIPGMAMPTLDPAEIDKRIADLRSIEGWLNMNLNMVRFSIQGLELQRATLQAMRERPTAEEVMQAFAFAHGPGLARLRRRARPSRPGPGLRVFHRRPRRRSGQDPGFSRDPNRVSATGSARSAPASSPPGPNTRTARRWRRWSADIDTFSVFSGRAPLKANGSFAVVHADPGAPDLPGLVSDMSAKVDTGYIVGGVSSSRSRTVQIANEVLSGGLSGAVLGEEVAVATRLTQGCTPYPGRFRVTEGEENIIARLDGRPALEVLLEAVGGERTQLLVGLPVPGSEAGAHFSTTPRAISSASTPRPSLVAIGDAGRARHGNPLLQARRGGSAKGSRRHLSSLKARCAAPPRCALLLVRGARRAHVRKPGCGTGPRQASARRGSAGRILL